MYFRKIIFCLVILAIISIATIYSATLYLPGYLNNIYLKQIIFYILSIGLIFIIMKIGNKTIFRYVYYLYGLGNVLLLLLLFFGEEINNSKCWFTIPYLGSFQPSEFMKIILIFTLAVFVSSFYKKHKNPSVKQELYLIVMSGILTLIPTVLTFLEPDTGVVIIYLLIFVTVLFTCGLRKRWFVLGFSLLAVIIGGVFYLYFYQEELFIKIFSSSIYYRIERLISWQSGSGLQLENSISAIGSSGFFGFGYRNTPIYFPESSTDFIFAVFASNFGFLGTILLLGLFAFLDITLLQIAKTRKNFNEKLILLGTVSILLFQQMQNIGMTFGLVPITGITLPFISYGGSSLFSYMILIGIILNIVKEKDYEGSLSLA